MYDLSKTDYVQLRVYDEEEDERREVSFFIRSYYRF